jgi:lambda family phage tail tape measure protein
LNAGTLWIEMAANLARLQKDMNDAKGIVSGASNDISRTIGQVKTALGALGVGLSFHVIKQQFDQVTERMARFEDATEKVGSTVEKMSRLEFFSKMGGSNLDGITGALVKLSKGMSGAHEETQSASQAFEFLGLSAKDAQGNLKDPADLLEEIAKSLADYKDGAGKAAIAQAMLGKSGAEMLPTLKKMVELGAINASVTAEQAKAAGDYQDRMMLLNRNSEMLWNTVVGALLPSMESFVKVMLKAQEETGSMAGAAKNLANDRSIENWADSAAMSVAFIIDAVKTLVPVIELVGAGFASLIARQDVALRINPLSAAAMWIAGKKPLDDYATAVETAKLAQEEFSRKLETFLNRDVQGTQNAMAAMIASRKANREDAARDAEGSSRPGGTSGKELNFKLGDAKLAAAELKLYEGAVRRLSDELGKVNDQSESEKLNFELYGKSYMMADGSVVHLTGSLEKLSAAHKAILPHLAAEVDRRKQLIEVSKIQFESSEALLKVQQQLLQIQTQSAEADKNYLEDLRFQIDLLGKTSIEQAELNELRKIDLKLRGDLKAAADAAGDNMAAYDATRDVLVRQAEQQKRSVRAAIADRTRAERDWLTGAQHAFNEYSDHATNAADQTRNALVGGMHAVEDTIYEVLRHGKLQFSDFASFVKDIAARIGSQQITLQIGTTIAGSLGLSTAANAAGNGMGGLNLLSGLPSVGTAFSNLSGAVSTFTTLTDLGVGTMEAFSAAATGMGASAMSLLGPIGLAIGAASMFGLFDDEGPKASDASIKAQYYPDGTPIYSVEMNNVAGGDPDMAQVLAMNKLLADPTKFDPAKLAGLVGQQVGNGGPADTATLLNLLTQALGPAAESAKALADATKQVEAANLEAAEAARVLAAERRSLEVRLMEAQGNAAGALAAKRELEIEATNDLNRELLRQIHAAEDAATAQAAANKAQEDAARVSQRLEDASRSRVLDAVGLLQDAYQREASSLEQMAEKWRTASQNLREYGASLVSSSTGTISYTAAARRFSDVARRAQLGDFDAINSLQGVSEQFRQASLGGSASALDYTRDVARIQNVILATASLADRQETVSLQQRDLLKSQVSELIDVNGNLVSVKDAIALLEAKVRELTTITKNAADDTKDTKDIIEAVTQGQLSFSTEAAA